VSLSHAFNQIKLNWSIPEKELYDLIYSLDMFKPYLFGPQFTWITDAKCLTWLNRVKDTSPKLLRRCLQVQKVDFTIQHKPGKYNVIPDALYRVILDFASNHTRRLTTSETPIATLTPVLELVVEPQAPYDSKDDVAISYDSLTTIDNVHHGAASNKRASIDHIVRMSVKWTVI
jgi:RNase H-like domain found in reverse transcriptase